MGQSGLTLDTERAVVADAAVLPRDTTLECEDVDVTPIFRELTETMRAFYPEMKLQAELPDRPVRANLVLLRQMLQHLVDSGFRQGGRNVQVEFTFERCPDPQCDPG